MMKIYWMSFGKRQMPERITRMERRCYDNSYPILHWEVESQMTI